MTLERSLILSASAESAVQWAALRIQRESVSEAPPHKAWHTVGLQQMPSVGYPNLRARECLNLRSHRIRLLLSFLQSHPPSFTGQGAAQPPAQLLEWGWGEVWPAAALEMLKLYSPQQGLWSPPLAQALGPSKSLELKGTRCLH